MPSRWSDLLKTNMGVKSSGLSAAVFLCVGALTACGEIKSATEYLISGNEAFKRSDYKQAEVDYRKALEKEPKSSTALNNLGVVLNELSKYDESVGILNRAIEIDPKNSIAHYTLSRALTKKGEFTAAIEEAKKSIHLASSELDGHRALADASLQKAKKENNKDDLSVAMEEYRLIIQTDSDDDGAHEKLGEALALNADPDGAIVEERKAVELNPDNLPARKLLARLLSDKGDKAGALKELEVVLQKDASDQEARKLRSEIQGS